MTPKKAHQPEIEMPENLKEHFSKNSFYGLHAGNNKKFDFKNLTKFAELFKIKINK